MSKFINKLRSGSKKAKKSRSSSSESSVTPTSELPQCAVGRGSPVFESSSPSASDAGATEMGSTEISKQGELFDDDPQRVATTETRLLDSQAEEVRLKKSSDEEENESMERELKKREAEMKIQVMSKSTLGRLITLFSTYADNHQQLEQELEALEKSHAKALESLQKDLQTACQEKEDLQNQLKEHMKSAEERGKEEGRLKTQLTDEVSKLKEDVKQLESQLEKEKQIHETAAQKAAGRDREFNEKHEHDSQEIQRLNQRCTQLEEEKQHLVQLREDDEKVEQKLHGEDVEQKKALEEKVTKLQQRCTEQEQKITELEQTAGDAVGSTAKMQGLEKTIKSYEDKVMKLEKRLQEEERLRKQCEEQLKTTNDGGDPPVEHDRQESDKDMMELKRELEETRHQLQKQESDKDVMVKELKKTEEELEESRHQLQKQETNTDVMMMELKKREEKLEESRHQLQRTEEQLKEQETKREESQRNLETLQKTMKKLQTSSKSSAELEEYFDDVTKFCEEHTTLAKQSEEQKKKIAGLKRIEVNAKKIEAAYVMKTEKLSEVETQLELLQVEVRNMKREQVEEESSTEVKVSPAMIDSGDATDEGSRTIKKMKQEIFDLKEKLYARDEALREIKQGNNPLSNPLTSPTESMTASSEEVASYRQQLRKKEQELENMRAQVASFEGVLQHREKLQKEAAQLKQEVASLSNEKQGLSEHIKKQSREVLSLKEKLKTSQTGEIAVVSEPQSKQLEEEVKKWRLAAESAHRDVQELKTKVDVLAKERDHFREEALNRASAFEKANEQAQKYQHLQKEVATLKERAEEMRSNYACQQEENRTLKRMVEDGKKDRESAITAEKERNAIAAHEIQRELERLREESHQKDLILQSSAEEDKKKTERLEELQEKLTAADARYKELAECNEDLIKNKHQISQDELTRKDEAIAELQQELKAKIAQVKQYKKQLEKEKADLTHDKQKPEEEMEDLQLEVAKSRSALEETQKRFKDASHKNAEMEAHYRKQVEEKGHKLQQLLEENEALVAQVGDLKTKEQLLQKEAELQLVTAQQQQTGMATELSRLQKDRKREDEFSKAFQQEFEANKALRATCDDLRRELDGAMDSLDGLRQQQQVLMMTLKVNNIPLPFVEPEPRPAIQHIVDGTPRYPQHAPVAISQKPIASPGLYNQQVENVGYMPPHSNAELQYREQLAQRQQNTWQQQQHQYGHQQHPHQGAPHLVHPAQAPLNAHLSTAQSNAYEAEPVVGIPPSALTRRTLGQQPYTSQLPLQSRQSEGEMQQCGNFPRQVVGNMHQPSYPQHMEQMQSHHVHPQSVESVAAGQHGQQQFQPTGTIFEPGVSAPSCLQPQPHGYQQPHAMPVSPLMQSPLPHLPQDDTCAQQYPTVPSPVHGTTVVTAVPETTPSVPQEPAHGTEQTAKSSVFQQPSEIVAGNVAAPSQPNLLITRNDSEPNAGELLMRNLDGTIADTVAEVNENEAVGDSIASGLQSIPPDPNLTCVVCGKVFKIGEIQKYKRHVKTCTGSE